MKLYEIKLFFVQSIYYETVEYSYFVIRISQYVGSIDLILYLYAPLKLY